MGEETKYSCLQSYIRLCEVLEETCKEAEKLAKLKTSLEIHLEKEYGIRSEDLWKICNK